MFLPHMLSADITLCTYFVIFNDLQYSHDPQQHYMTYTLLQNTFQTS
jgi:hypothetical protein